MSNERTLILAEATKPLDLLTRRLFLARAVGLGTLSLLAGCDITDGDRLESALSGMSNWNDRVQTWLFARGRLAREYAPSMIQRPFPFNSFYHPNTPDGAPQIDPATWVLNVTGRVADRRDWRLADLQALPMFTQITRHICIEGWSAVGLWTGIRLSDFLIRVGADLTARYVTFRCDDNYVTSIDMPSALHSQTQLCLSMDGRVLERAHGFPLKLRIPTKLGFKNAKHIGEIEVGNTFTGGTWETYGYNWFAGL